MNVLKNDKKTTVITLLLNGIPHREISRKVGVDPKTIRRIARGVHGNSDFLTSESVATRPDRPAIQNPPPWPPNRGESSAAAEAIAGAPPTAARSACEPHREFIEAQVRLGRNAVAIYQDLVDGHGFANAYNSVKRFVGKTKWREPERFDRLDFLPGEEAQVDYGEGAPTLNPKTGKLKRPRLFVMTLRFSRRSFRKVVWNSSQETWAKLHEEAFSYFGGVPQYVVLDNLKEGVIKADIYEPALNPVYAAMLAHYGVVADPARVCDPNRKGTVESAIGHTQSTALKGRTYHSIEEQNEFLMHWEKTWAATRIHGRAKRQVEEMFQEERPFLKALPPLGFRYFREEARTVHDDGLIQVGQSYYAALPARIGARVIIRIYELELEIYSSPEMNLLRRHTLRARRGSVVMDADDRIFNPSRETERLLKQAHAIGPWTGKLCAEIFSREGRVGNRKIYGVVNLARKATANRIEAASRAAFEKQAYSSSVVKRLALYEEAATPTAPGADGLLQEHEIIRPAHEYHEFWEQNALSAGEHYAHLAQPTQSELLSTV